MDHFNELKFETHPNVLSGFNQQAKVFFDNGLGASVVTGPSAYGNYELAVIEGTNESWRICYSTPITDDVIGVDTSEEIDKLLSRIESLVWE
jgi:hypothetical protein